MKLEDIGYKTPLLYRIIDWIGSDKRNKQLLKKSMQDCKDDKCEINVSEELYKQLHKDIFFILCPTAMQQLKPNSWAYATSRKRIDEIMVVVRKFVAERLVEYVAKKE